MNQYKTSTNENKTRKTETNFDLIAQIENYETILIKRKIRFSQHIAKILLKQQNSNQVRHCLTGHNQILHHFIYQTY